MGPKRYTHPPVSTYDTGSADPDAWVYDKDYHLLTHRSGACETCDDYFDHFHAHLMADDPSLEDARASFKAARDARADEEVEGSNDEVEEDEEEAEDTDADEEIAGLHRVLKEVRQERYLLRVANDNLHRRLALALNDVSPEASLPDSPHLAPGPRKRPCSIHRTPTPPPAEALAGPSHVAGDSG